MAAADPKVVTRVIYRTYPKAKDGSGGDVIALLLDCAANLGRVVCYQHVGQHGEAQYFHVMASTTPSTEAEIIPLRDELIRIGYAPIQRKRRSIQSYTNSPRHTYQKQPIAKAGALMQTNAHAQSPENRAIVAPKPKP